MATLQEISQPFSLKKIANAIYVLFTPSATEKHLLLSVNVDKKLPSVLFGNQISIYRVILNLVGNAIKFTQQGSVNLTVKMQEQIDKDHVLVNILVRDTGIGIPEEKHQIIFDKLERLAPSYSEGQKGHGIGLYIVDQYVKAMNGRIKVESTLEKGSCFTVTLPLKVLKKNQDEIIHFPERIKKPRSRKRAATFSQGIVSASVVLEENAPIILLVEDHPMIQEMTHTILKSVGAHVDIASTGQEALELFSTKKYTVIYMDIGLPDMGGYDVARCLRAIEKRTKQRAYTDYRSICPCNYRYSTILW
ncbi:MAG: ATP-binding protein [Gammaproteobacteria bacterium]|nr:ATP-binding protein [Gammaproteobacteria bacterium]